MSLIIPQNLVTVNHGGADYTLNIINCFVRRKENGFDTATLVLDDTHAQYSDVIANDDFVTVKVKDGRDSSWTTLFYGPIRSVDPVLDMDGSLIKVECDGAGFGLGTMLCGDEYGTDSANSGLDTIKTIIEDNNNGIVDAWTNSVLGDTAKTSGITYTTQIETVAGTIGYIYFPYKPCTKAINDVCDIVQAIKGTNAGVHWICDTSNRVLLATVGNHGTPASTYWRTYWNTTAAASTLTEGKHFGKFRFNIMAKEANYVLYHGSIVKPLREDWTEGNAASWGATDCTVGNDAADYKMGAASIQITMDNGAGAGALAYYPSTLDLGLNIDAMGGEYSFPIFHAWSQLDAAYHAADADANFAYAFITDATHITVVTELFLVGGAGRESHPNPLEYYEHSFPIGSNWEKRQSDLPAWLTFLPKGGNWADWTDINAIGVHSQFEAAVDGSDIWIDGMYISGTVQRAARQAAAYTASDPCKMKLITDSVAKDDTMNAADDSGLVGRLLYAEYLRSSSEPTVGSFTTDQMFPKILPGQLIPLKAKKKASGLYSIDKNFRALRVMQNIVGDSYSTTVEVTDDVKNSNPRPVPNQYNALLTAVRPETQDRQASSIKLRDIDITQPILEKSY